MQLDKDTVTPNNMVTLYLNNHYIDLEITIRVFLSRIKTWNENNKERKLYNHSIITCIDQANNID